MRRLVTVCSLAMLAVCVSPVPAHAYFWEWLDSLSGPRFGGVIGELQLKCWPRSVAASLSELDALKQKVDADQLAHTGASVIYRGEAQVFAGNAARYSAIASRLLAMSREAVRAAEQQADEDRKAGRKPSEKPNVAGAVVEALAWQARADQHFAWAKGLHERRKQDPRQKPGTFDENVRIEATAFAAPVCGVRYSLCRYQALDRDRFFLTGNVGFAVDIKNDDEHSPGRHLMLTTGGSAHAVVTPWLTAGVGAGRAVFFPSGGSTFGKWYFQPYILDIKPGAMVPRADFRSPWRHFVYLRYSMITFPQGFEASRFSPNSAAYEQEWIQSLGIHFDLTPVLRGRKGNW